MKWTLTRDAFKDYKKPYEVYGIETVTDEYGNEQGISSPKFEINVMWMPVVDEATYTAYGATAETMKQAAYYGSEEVEHGDQLYIDNERFEIVTVQKYNNYTLLKARKIMGAKS